jgi:mannitol/fructose-specific phosphotransferase system IIA component (Ntr-type)
VVLVSAREGTLSWRPRLERLPRLLASATLGAGEREGPLLIVYPGEPAADESSAAPRIVELEDYLAPSRVVANLTAQPFERALERLLDTEFARQPVQREVILTSLVQALMEDTAELRPGVALPHLRVQGVSRPLLFLGVSGEGIEFPHASEPTRVIFLLVSPREAPDQHLRALSAIAGLCADETRLNEVLQQYGFGPLPPVEAT